MIDFLSIVSKHRSKNSCWTNSKCIIIIFVEWTITTISIDSEISSISLHNSWCDKIRRIIHIMSFFARTIIHDLSIIRIILITSCRKTTFFFDIIIIIDHTRFDVDFSRLMREHLCKICMREKFLKRRKISFYASSERSHWVNYSTYYVLILLYLWLFFLLS